MIYHRCECLFRNPFSPLPTSEHRRQCSDLHHLLPPVQGDAAGQTAEQGGGDPDPAVDLHQVLPGEILGHRINVYMQNYKSAKIRIHVKMCVVFLNIRTLRVISCEHLSLVLGFVSHFKIS